jgi:hypothetical protein
MKKLRNVILSAAIVLIGAGAAFATNATKSAATSEEGYYFDSTSKECVTPGRCSSSIGTTCTWTAGGVTHNLCRLSDTNCTMQLAKLP